MELTQQHLTSNSFNQIRNTHGQNVITLMNEYDKHNMKLAKTTASIGFLEKCRQTGILPKFISSSTNAISSQFDTNSTISPNVESTIMHFHQKLLNLHIKENFVHKNGWTKKLGHLNTKIIEAINEECAELFLQQQQHKFTSQLQRNRAHLNTKFDKLFAAMKGKYYLNTDEQMFKNLTEVEFPESTKWLIGLGPKFAIAVANNEIPLIKIIAEVENILLRNTEETERDAKRVRVCHILKKGLHRKFEDVFLKTFIGNALKETQQFLKSHREIIIVKADKGNCSVAMLKSEYKEKMDILLSDTSTYEVLNKDPTTSLDNKHNELLKTLHREGTIEKSTLRCLTRHNFSIPKIYALPKIHKNNCPLRPIVSKVESVGADLIKFVTPLLKRLSNTKLYNIKNSFELLQRLENITINEDELMISLDVTSMFPSIPMQYTLEKIESKLYETVFTGITSETFLRIMRFVSQSTNYFTYNNIFYRQKDGCPMGNGISPDIADFLLNSLLDFVTDKLGFEFKLLVKYVDDLLLIIPRRLLSEILDIFNGFHDNIQFTVEEEKDNKLAYLDVLLIRDEVNNRILTDFYYKPTASGRIINFYSQHPKHVIKNTAYNFISRVLSLSANQFHVKNKKYIVQTLKRNSFPENLIHSLISKFVATNNNETSIDTVRLRPRVTFSALSYVKGTSELISKTISDATLSVAYKPLKKLGDLVFTKLKDKVAVHDRHNIIYKIPCKGGEGTTCDQSYIGQTKNSLNHRLKEHKRDLKHCTTERTALVKHFITDEHIPDFDNASVIDYEKNNNKRNVLEALHIVSNKTYNYRRDTAGVCKFYHDLLRQHTPQSN